VRFNTEGLFIKVSGVTSEQDALFSIGLGANAIGFEFGPTPRRITSSEANDIVRRLPQGALSVGVFVNELPQKIVEVANTIGLSAVQIDGTISSASLEWVAERVTTVIRSLPNADVVRATKAIDGVDYFLLPEYDDVQTLQECLEVFADRSIPTPLIASGGLNSSNVVDVVQNFPVWGVDVRSGVESEPGLKDPVLLGEFIANARWASANAYVERQREEWRNF
jgi:phosphoribosylanthranilate isomerase